MRPDQAALNPRLGCGSAGACVLTSSRTCCIFSGNISAIVSASCARKLAGQDQLLGIELADADPIA